MRKPYRRYAQDSRREIAIAVEEATNHQTNQETGKTGGKQGQVG
jgi:hypothetical protein